eukprot:1161832-Pelagomonas_calceolata.AAC.9
MHDTPPVINKEDNNYHSALFDPAKMRTDIKPLDVIQPEGPSFKCSRKLSNIVSCGAQRLQVTPTSVTLDQPAVRQLTLPPPGLHLECVLYGHAA